jgi:uncharacterized membrane protein YfcA
MACFLASALGGNWIGKLVIDRLDDVIFRRIGRIAILLIGAAYLLKAGQEWELY